MARTKQETKWTDALVERVRIMWEDKGMNGSEIAHYLGNGITRCAVIGIVHRRNMQCRVATTRKITGWTGRPPEQKLIKKPEPKVLSEIEAPSPLVTENGTHINLDTVSERNCHWPYGDPESEDFHYCGHPPMRGKPYCEAHANAARRPTRKMLMGTEK